MSLPEPIQNVFNQLTEKFATKNVEYKGSHTDLFRNFNQGAALSGETPEQVLLGYVNKQIVSLFDAKNQNPERLQEIEFINEKAGDIAVYMVLLMAMAGSSPQQRTKASFCSDGLCNLQLIPLTPEQKSAIHEEAVNYARKKSEENP